ncbi:helix-turn-helix transcriptional regulator [Sulfitobacter sp. D35]|uniref:helix-turn-helix domain-containing protein n=1 Tax=Sulfitobacter sp. D35 TaxID=3083252 RepID=UPI0029700614|nr:helix-turn-helix transcriptional regulator [Sulfitobacter sp. D35]MDW4496688.1 helix-turn-helix transcriptional regulator [Sulfitobacter sp. D35]
MKHYVDIHVGQKLKQIRRHRRMSQTEVAEQLNISFQQVQKYEMGTNRIAASRLFDLAQVLNVPTSYFFEGMKSEDDAQAARDTDAQILDALSAIKDDRLKLRIMTFVNDICGVAQTRTA